MLFKLRIVIKWAVLLHSHKGRTLVVQSAGYPAGWRKDEDLLNQLIGLLFTKLVEISRRKGYFSGVLFRLCIK